VLMGDVQGVRSDCLYASAGRYLRHANVLSLTLFDRQERGEYDLVVATTRDAS
jgi:hypothetical protein